MRFTPRPCSFVQFAEQSAKKDEKAISEDIAFLMNG